MEDIVKKIKRQGTIKEKIFTDEISDYGFVFRIYNGISEPHNKESKKHRGKTYAKFHQKNVCMENKHMKDIQYR